MSSEISGDKTATPKITWPALSKIFDNLASWLILNTGFLFRSQFFIPVYDNLEFVYVLSGGEPPVRAAGLEEKTKREGVTFGRNPRCALSW